MSYSWAAYQLHMLSKYHCLNKANNHKSHIFCINYHRAYIPYCIPSNYYSSSRRHNFTLSIRRMCYYKELYLICMQGILYSEQSMKYMIHQHIEELLSNCHFQSTLEVDHNDLFEDWIPENRYRSCRKDK